MEKEEEEEMEEEKVKEEGRHMLLIPIIVCHFA